MRIARHLGLIACVAGGTASGVEPEAGLEPLSVHLDLVPEWLGGSWTWRVATDSGSEDLSGVFLPLRDLDFADGERYLRPGGSQWDFLGVDEAEPVWILPQSDNGSTWPGFENGQSGVFGAYVESDPRVAGVAQPWIRIALAGAEGPGEFSMFQFQSGAPVVWMATSDGVGPEDVFFLASPGHSHMNWTFSAKGVYRIELRAQAYLGPGATNPTPAGEPVAVHFAVGARAAWRAEHFAAATVMEESVAGDGADPDGDLRPNLVEYAFGGDPLDPSPAKPGAGVPTGPELLLVEDGGERFPALRFCRRIHEDADLSYAVEWSDSVSGEWMAGGVEMVAEALDDRWERVTVRDTRPLSGRRFGRVAVEALP